MNLRVITAAILASALVALAGLLMASCVGCDNQPGYHDTTNEGRVPDNREETSSSMSGIGNGN